jgi:EEF1A N-terminal glycine/lysine methyltransferase
MSFLPHIFPDDAPSFHGDPGQHLFYQSRPYGSPEIMISTYPGQSEECTEEIAAGQSMNNDVEEGRKLFAHYLWSAAMVVAESVENAAQGDEGRE